jgi:hypothetical protein
MLQKSESYNATYALNEYHRKQYWRCISNGIPRVVHDANAFSFIVHSIVMRKGVRYELKLMLKEKNVDVCQIFQTRQSANHVQDVQA